MPKVVYFLFTLLLAWHCQAEDEDTVVVEALRNSDQQHLQQQVQKIDDLARIKLGTQIRGNKDDLELLQRLIYGGYIPKDDQHTQQALGAVLGNVMAKEFGLEWTRYKDTEGVSRALCVPNTEDCLFPITMLSRRMAVGILPDVNKIFHDAQALIQPFLPKPLYQPH